jgi:hypothetical protein
VRINGLLMTALVALGVVVAYEKYSKGGMTAGLRKGV